MSGERMKIWAVAIGQLTAVEVAQIEVTATEKQLRFDYCTHITGYRKHLPRRRLDVGGNVGSQWTPAFLGATRSEASARLLAHLHERRSAAFDSLRMVEAQISAVAAGMKEQP